MDSHEILVVDDEADIRELVQYNLEREGYTVHCAADGESALELASTVVPDLMILDLMLPGIDGHEVCMRLRNTPTLRDVPILMLTAKGEEADEVVGLRLGADDYLAKPFSVRVLLARIHALLRRQRRTVADDDQAVVVKDRLSIDPNRHEVRIDDVEIQLTPIEFKILYFLAGSPGRVFSRTRIIEAVQGEGVAITERTIDVHLVALRRKLGELAEHVETVRGIGYRYKE